jgi:hypothetical protein
MNVLLNPCYFGSIAYWLGIIQSDKLWFEVCDNYQKQTLRNRCIILGANGSLSLSIPVKYSQNNRQLYRDVRIAYDSDWQQLHLKSLASAYQMSPFYEYYIAEIEALFLKQWEYLIEFNFASLKTLANCLELPMNYQKTKVFALDYDHGMDLRSLSEKKATSPVKLKPYTQVFSQKFGFVSNLSILDLLFNEGPNSENYLLQQPPLG